VARPENRRGGKEQEGQQDENEPALVPSRLASRGFHVLGTIRSYPPATPRLPQSCEFTLWLKRYPGSDTLSDKQV
jgi:hypothetical protein